MELDGQSQKERKGMKESGKSRDLDVEKEYE